MTRREFHFEEGSSQKFWAIWVEGCSVTVHHGKVGTKGQTRVKEWPSEDKTNDSAQKWIAEKTNKGYTEVAASNTTPPPKPTSPASTPAIASPEQPPPASGLAVSRSLDLKPHDLRRAAWRNISIPELPRPNKPPLKFDYSYLDVQVAYLEQGWLSPEEMVDKYVNARNHDRNPWSTALWIESNVLPYFSSGERETLRQIVREQFRQKPWPQSKEVTYLAVILGLHDELLTLVESWADEQFRDDSVFQAGEKTPIVQGLATAQLVEYHFRRVGLRLGEPNYVRAWLAITEYTALDVVCGAILNPYEYTTPEKNMDAFCLVNAPEAAPWMLKIRLNSKVPRIYGKAQTWLEDHLGNAIVGLIPLTAQKDKIGDTILEFLRDARKRGHADFIEQQLANAPAEAADRVRAEVLTVTEESIPTLDDQTTPEWLTRELAQKPVGKAKVPGLVHPATLPPILIEGRCLTEEQVSRVLLDLSTSTLERPTPLITALSDGADRASLGAFSWKLFDSWMSAGAPPKEKWAMLSLGHFADDAAVLRLTPLIRVWPGESQHRRAVTGLEVLRKVATDTALMQLNGIAQKLKFKGLQDRAREMMQAIADDRGLTTEQLEDRIVPDLDLDPKGRKTFDFGPRQFTLGLSSELQPMVRDAAGKLLKDLPKPGVKDDAARANAAVAEWKALKKQLREVVSIQAFRLEQAMITSRRWCVGDFETLFVRHPLMTHLTQRLVWGGYNKDQLSLTFRVTDDHTYADAQDDACTLEENIHTVSIVHPLHLDDAVKAAWGQVLGDYDIISPFPQMGRPIHTLEPDEKARNTFRRHNQPVSPGRVRGLEQMGWRRFLHDHGGIVGFHKPFPTAEVAGVVIIDPGILLGMPDFQEEQTITDVFFVKDLNSPHYRERSDYKGSELPLANIDPMAVSEVIRDLLEIAPAG